MHLYAGVHLIAKAAVCLVMLTAATPSGKYAATWAGASTPAAHRWVQAGIVSINGRPYLYAESSGAHYRIQFYDWLYRLPIVVTINRRGYWWRATAGPIHTPWVRLRHAVRLVALELINGGHATASIDGRMVSA